MAPASESVLRMCHLSSKNDTPELTQKVWQLFQKSFFIWTYSPPQPPSLVGSILFRELRLEHASDSLVLQETVTWCYCSPVFQSVLVPPSTHRKLLQCTSMKTQNQQQQGTRKSRFQRTPHTLRVWQNITRARFSALFWFGPRSVGTKLKESKGEFSQSKHEDQVTSPAPMFKNKKEITG